MIDKIIGKKMYIVFILIFILVLLTAAFAFESLSPFFGKAEFSDLNNGMNILVTNDSENTATNILFTLHGRNDEYKIYSQKTLKNKAKIEKNISISNIAADNYTLMLSCDGMEDTEVMAVNPSTSKYMTIIHFNSLENGQINVDISGYDGYIITEKKISMN